MIHIRRCTPADLDAILAVTAASPGAASWSRESYRTMLDDPHLGSCNVAEVDNAVVGYICFRVMSDEAEVLNLAVLPSARRQGVASRLLDEVLSKARQQGAQRIFLEVRETNGPAISFYEGRGFRASSRRRGYYATPTADALVLARDLSAA